MKSLELYNLVIKYSVEKPELFLNKFNWRDIKTIRSMFGMLRLLTPAFCFYDIHFIFIKDRQSRAMFFGEVIHQLFYAYQEYRFGYFKFVLYYILFRWHFERKARREQEEAISWFLDNEKE